MRPLVSAIVLSLAVSCVAFAATPLAIVPTTTLAAETGNNTSASSLFLATANGNLAQANVSKVNTHTLTYPGYAGKIYAHLMSWFCMTPASTSTGAGTQCGSHVQVGYNSNDPAVVHAQAADMISRGFDGVIHDWYGPGNSRDDIATRNWIAEAEQHPGFQFALMIDQGALQWYSCISSGCSPTQALTQLTQYAAQNFFNSPAYMRINGRPVLTNFDIDLHYTVDWNSVAANTPGNPIFIFQNNGGFTHGLSSGSFSWVMPTDSNYGLDYLGSFYSTGMKYPAESTVGAMYKGFNDTLASWSGNRVMSQQCGQTWLQTFAKANSMFNTSQQLGAIQLVTWDDYEEGTELETGIDNCVSLTGAISASVLSWTISGNENTIDHYTVFISTDGQNLMPLGDFVVGTRQLDLSSFALAPGKYTLFVKAIGKPSLRNQMSNPVVYSVAASQLTGSLWLSATTAVAPATLSASVSGTSDPNLGGAITSSVINWGDGAASAGPSATHVYGKAGAYTVTAILTDNYGASATATGVVNINAAAVYITSPANGSTLGSPVRVTVNAVSGNPISAMVVYVDYNEVYRTYSGTVDTFVAMSAGAHLLVTNAWDSSGALLQAKSNITVGSGPTPALAVSISAATATASTSASTDSTATITSSVISWGDGATSAGPTATHTYARGGNYTITATLTDSLGLSSSKSAAVTAAGVVIWSPLNGAVAGSPVHVTATAYDSRKIASMIVYVDGAKKYLVYANTLDTHITMNKGTHRVTINSWEDVTGLVFQSSATVTVP